MILTVKVIPNASRNEIVGVKEGVLKVRIHAPADKGKANEELIVFLSESLKVPKSKITLLSGQTSRLKRIKIDAGEEILDSFK